MTEVLLSTTDILNHMTQGAKLHRAFGDKIELRMPNGTTISIPVSMFDALKDETRIISEGETSGFYRLA